MPIALTFLSVLFAYTMTTLDEIAETLDLFDDWDQHYHYLVELGEQLQQMHEPGVDQRLS